MNRKEEDKLVMKLRGWKRKLRDGATFEDSLEELQKIIPGEWDSIWLTSPKRQAPAHLAAYFKRWDLLNHFLDYHASIVNPFHRNEYHEDLETILREHKDCPEAMLFICKIRELKKHFCKKCSGIRLLGKYCPKCYIKREHVPSFFPFDLDEVEQSENKGNYDYDTNPEWM